MHFKVRNLEPTKVGEIDVCSDDLAVLADLLGEPDGHGSPSRPDLKASPARPDHGTPSAREWIEDSLQEAQPIVFGVLASFGVESVAGARRLNVSGLFLELCHVHVLFN